MTRLLIVEDDPAQARALARAFSKLRPDFTILTSSNGVEATALMNERGVDLVLTDLQMAEMDGFELLAWILSNCPDVSVFTMSAFGTNETAERLNALGALENFQKPIEPKAVLARIVDALSQSVRGHVQNVSLASFLQLMEMERKTCSLAIRSDDKMGVLVIRKGALVDAGTGDLRGEEAAVAIVAWSNPSITISKTCESGPSTIEKPLGFIVMEAMRVQDESVRNLPVAADGSVFPPPRRTVRPSAGPFDSVVPARAPSAAPTNGHVDWGLPHGARAIAIVDTATGNVLRSSVKDGCPLDELARMAATVLQQETQTIDLCNLSEGIEELVLSTTLRCDVIRPLGGRAEFAMLSFAPDETNLMMARLELAQFIARHSS